METVPTRRGFARLLWRLADLVQVAETRRSFRAKAYRRAVWALDDIPSLEIEEAAILDTPGIGPGVASLIREYRDTGGLNQLIPLEAAYPREARRLRRLPRMTPRMLRDLKTGLGVETVGDLLDAIESDATATIHGVGPETTGLWRRILTLPPDRMAIPAYQAWALATDLAAHIHRHNRVEVEIAGGVRRVDEWVTRLDLVVVTDDREGAIEFLEESAVLTDVKAGSDDVVEVSTHADVPVAIHLSGPAEAGTALISATGPELHLVRLGALSPHPTESEAYRDVGAPWTPPAARLLPMGAAAETTRLEEIRGDLHLHTDASPDGRMAIETILNEAVGRGYEYVLITDHTLGLRFGGLGAAEIADQAHAIDQVRAGFPQLTVWHGAELNIGPDGSLDLDDAGLAMLDFAVAGVHSHFGLTRSEQTARVSTALSHPVVRVLAHPFGRRIGIRPCLDIDMDAVIASAIRHGVALEANGHRDRLDLPADWVATAAAAGALLAANSDAHRLGEMGNVANAVAILQRAGVTSDHVINTRDAAAMTQWISASPESA